MIDQPTSYAMFNFLWTLFDTQSAIFVLSLSPVLVLSASSSNKLFYPVMLQNLVSLFKSFQAAFRLFRHRCDFSTPIFLPKDVITF